MVLFSAPRPTEPAAPAAKPKKDVLPVSLETTMGSRKAMSAGALIHAPEIHAPLSDELRGSLRNLSVSIFN